MRTITKLQTLLVLFLTTAMIGFVGCKDDDDDVPAPDGGGTVATYAIGGTVMAASNNPMAGVSVALSGAQSLSATTVIMERQVTERQQYVLQHGM